MFFIWPAIAISAQINQSIKLKTENVKFEVKGDYTQIIYGIRSSTDSIGHPDVAVMYKRYAIPLDAVNVYRDNS